MKKYVPTYEGTLRKKALEVPRCISECSGIRVFGRRIKSLVFSTDVAIIKNINADAVIAVYPFTPQASITQAIIGVSDVPVFVGVGGGLTQGKRVLHLASYAEMQGACGVVVNAPTTNEVVSRLVQTVDIPVVVTVVRPDEDIDARVAAGTTVFNVSASARTPELVHAIRTRYPEMPIIATGGPTEESIRRTIEAGANAITWTPPSNGEIFKDIMQAYRENKPHP